MSYSGTGATKTEAIMKAAIKVCKPCCGPCGSAGCPCCPGVRWWATQWHKLWTVETPKIPGTGTDFTLIDYSVTLNPDLEDVYYFGDVASDESQCTIGGLVSVDGECQPVGPVLLLSGTVTYKQIAPPFTEETHTIEYYADLVLSFTCDGSSVRTVLFDGFYVDGLQWDGPYFATADIALLGCGDTDGPRDGACAFTMDLSVLSLPNITLTTVM